MLRFVELECKYMVDAMQFLQLNCMLEYFHNELLLGKAFISRKGEQSFFSLERQSTYRFEHKIYSQIDQE